MTKEEWESLTSSSGWGAIKRYLKDARARLGEQILNGQVKDADLKEAIYRAQNLHDLSEMDWPTIAMFYNIPLEELKEE